MRGWIIQVVPKRAKTALDNRKWDSMEELADALRDYLAIEGEFGPDKSQPFQTQAQGAKEGRFSCFKCGAPDHKVVDCHVSKLSVQQQRSSGQEEAAEKRFTCYSCGKVGHKSPQCLARQQQQQKPASTERLAKPKPIGSVNLRVLAYCLGQLTGRKLKFCWIRVGRVTTCR